MLHWCFIFNNNLRSVNGFVFIHPMSMHGINRNSNSAGHTCTLFSFYHAMFMSLRSIMPLSHEQVWNSPNLGLVFTCCNKYDSWSTICQIDATDHWIAWALADSWAINTLISFWSLARSSCRSTLKFIRLIMTVSSNSSNFALMTPSWIASIRYDSTSYFFMPNICDTWS